MQGWLTMGRDKYGADPGDAGFPPWNPEGKYPMPVLTEEILDFICFGRIDPRTKRASGGHISDALPKGGGKKQHSEFPASWTRETVREAFYHVIQNAPITNRGSMLFTGSYQGVEIEMRYSLNKFVSEAERLHLYPVRGRGVRLWENGKEVRVGQKRRK